MPRRILSQKVRKRKVLTRKTDVEWAEEIKNCLTAGNGSPLWGCLDKHGKLFRIRTLNTIIVPTKVIDEMKYNDLIELNDERQFYVYIGP